LAIDTVEASRERMTEMPTFGLPLRMDRLSMSAKPSLISATWFRRTMVSPLRLTTTCENLPDARCGRPGGCPSRPVAAHLADRRIGVLGAQGVGDLADRDVVLAQLSARSSTDSSRRSEPLTLTLATPSMARKRSASTSSARREISAWLCPSTTAPGS
jgi:hypothetical protein